MKAVIAVVFALMLAAPAHAQDLSALAKLDPVSSVIGDAGQGVLLELAISQPVPWRVRLLDNPPRLVLDVREVDWSGLDRVPRASRHITGLRAGVVRAGWSRLVLDLAGPLRLTSAEMTTQGPARIVLRLEPTDAASFAREAALPEPAQWALPRPVDLPVIPPQPQGPLVVVLDPGHGGIDPGAEREDQTEAALMLLFAREFKELLLRDGDFAVVMTREDDSFVPLEARISVARAAGAAVFISLHADALAEGEAVGATIYTLDAEASDEAAAALAERHDRDDLLAGVDLTGADDLVAEVLMDMARTETAPRTQRLADALQAAITGAELKMHRHPQQQAGFSVLKSPDIPSVLVELGFLSSARDAARLQDPEWRARMAQALLAGLTIWATEDETLRGLRP